MDDGLFDVGIGGDGALGTAAEAESQSWRDNLGVRDRYGDFALRHRLCLRFGAQLSLRVHGPTNGLAALEDLALEPIPVLDDVQLGDEGLA